MNAFKRFIRGFIIGFIGAYIGITAFNALNKPKVVEVVPVVAPVVPINYDEDGSLDKGYTR